MFARYYAQTAELLARGRAPVVPGSADALTRVLYRTLLRQTRCIEETAGFGLGGSYLSPCVTRHVQALCALIDVPRTGLRPMSERCERPSELVRQAFRELSDPSPDKAFAALRSAEQIAGWLDINLELHRMAEADQPVEVGACLIGKAIERSSEGSVDRSTEGSAPSKRLEDVQAALDEMAAQVRACPPLQSEDNSQKKKGCTTTQLLDQLNQVLYSAGTDRCGEWGQPFAVEWGDRGDVRLGGSLAHVLRARQGSPLMLCAIHQAVAARLGLTLSFVNFPGHVLLRVDTAAVGDVDSPDTGSAWYIDPAANGRRLSSAAVRHALRQLGMHKVDDQAWLSAVEPPIVWARILRNVEQGFKRKGLIREAWTCRSLAGGLHPEGLKMPEARLDLLGKRLQHIWPVDENQALAEMAAEELAAP